MLESGEGAVAFAVESALVAIHEVELATFVGEGGKGEAGAGVVGLGGEGVGVEFHFAGEAGGLDGPGALETPVGGGEFLDEGEFGGGFGLVFVDEGVDEAVEEGAGFAVDQDEAGEEAVGGVVAGGIAFAFGGDGATGITAVFAAGFALFWCTLHTLDIMQEGILEKYGCY